MTWGEFKEKLKECGLTRLQFCKEVGVSKSTPNNWKKIGIPLWVEVWFLGYTKRKGTIKKSLKVAQKAKKVEVKTGLREEILQAKPRTYKNFRGYPSLEEVIKNLRSIK